MDSCELIELFYNRAYEKFVNKQILDDKNYIVPRQQLTNYVYELVKIPFAEFIDHIKHSELERIIETSDITQFSSFSVCEIEMCNALLWANNPGCQYVDIGRFFPNNIISKSEVAYKRYGESHIKAATQLGLTFGYYNYWYLSCLGYIYPSLSEKLRKKLLARTITRNRLYQQMLLDILEHDVKPEAYMDMLGENIMRRRLRNVCSFLEICLAECKEGKISTYSLIKSFDNHRQSFVFQIPTGISKYLRTYLNDFDYRTLSNETTADLILKYRNGDHKAYDILVRGYMRLVLVIARSYNHKGVEFDDLIQEGTLGLIKAFDHFNANVNVEFSKYASWWIMQSITQALVNLPLIVQIPANVITLHKKVWSYIEYFEQEQGYPPSVIDIDVNDIDDLEWISYICQLPSNIKDITCFIDDFDIYESNDSILDDLQEKEYQKYYADRLLHRLEDKHYIMMKKYYGIDSDNEGDSLNTIGEYFGLSRERVRQIIEKAILRMRGVSENNDELDEEQKTQPILKPFAKAIIGDYVTIPESYKTGKVIDIQKNGSNEIYVLRTEDKVILKYTKNGILVTSKRKKKQMTPERKAFIRDFYFKQNNSASIQNSSTKKKITNNLLVTNDDSAQPRRCTNRSSNVVVSKRNVAKIGDRILFDSKYYTVIEKRSMGGFARLIVRCDDGTIDNLPNDNKKYTVL